MIYLNERIRGLIHYCAFMAKVVMDSPIRKEISSGEFSRAREVFTGDIRTIACKLKILGKYEGK